MSVDRSTTTPFLIRIFPSHGNFHRLSEFEYDLQPRDELNLYSWKDATLEELTGLLAKELVGNSGRALSSFKFSYRLIFGDNNKSRYQSRDIGTVQIGAKNTDAGKTLENARFVIGDWIDVAVLQPGDRLYDSRSNDRFPPRGGGSAGGGGGYRGGYGGSRGGMDRGYRGGNDSYRPYDRNERMDRNGRDGYRGGAPTNNQRWDNDSYRSRR